MNETQFLIVNYSAGKVLLKPEGKIFTLPRAEDSSSGSGYPGSVFQLYDALRLELWPNVLLWLQHGNPALGYGRQSVAVFEHCDQHVLDVLGYEWCDLATVSVHHPVPEASSTIQEELKKFATDTLFPSGFHGKGPAGFRKA